MSSEVMIAVHHQVGVAGAMAAPITAPKSPVRVSLSQNRGKNRRNGQNDRNPNGYRDHLAPFRDIEAFKNFALQAEHFFLFIWFGVIEAEKVQDAVCR